MPRDWESIENFIQQINDRSLDFAATGLEETGFCLRNNVLHRTWLLGNEVYALAYHVTRSVFVTKMGKELSKEEFTRDTGLQGSSYLSNACIPKFSSESKKIISTTGETRMSGIITPWDIASNWFVKVDDRTAITILRNTIESWNNYRKTLLEFTEKKADRFIFTKLVPLDPKLAPVLVFSEFGSSLIQRYNDAKKAGGNIEAGEYAKLAKDRTIRLFSELSAPYKKPCEISLDKLKEEAMLSHVSQTERSILTDRRFLEKIEGHFGDKTIRYFYCSKYQLDTHGPGCPSNTSLIDFIEQTARSFNATPRAVVNSGKNYDKPGNISNEKYTLDQSKEFNLDSYIEDLASLSYFADLGYRSDVEGGHLNVKDFIERQIISKGTTMPLAELVNFKDIRVKILSSRAGEGKTSSLIALIRSFSSKETALSSRLGFEESDPRRNQVPFFFSFNPGRGLSRAVLKKGSYSEILKKLMCGKTRLPRPKELEQHIISLGEKAFFIIDALDEANDLSTAIEAIEDLTGKFPLAGFVISTRPLTERFSFAPESENEYCLKELTRTQRIEFVKKYLIDGHNDLALNDDVLNRYAKILVDAKYTSRMISIPIFASVAARGWCYDKDNQCFKDIAPGLTFQTVSNVLLEKSTRVLEPLLNSVFTKEVCDEQASKSAVSTLGPLPRAKKMMRRLALATFLRSKFAEEVKSSFGDIADEANMVSNGGMKWDLVKQVMKTIAHNLSFPEANCDPNAWRHYLIASGCVSCSPDTNGGVFSFDSRDMQIYLAACGLSDLVASGRQSDCFGILRDLLNSSPDEDTASLIVMLLFCIDPGNDGSQKAGPGYADCEVVGSSLEIINCVICELTKVDEDTGGYDGPKHQALLQAIQDIRNREFCDSQLVRFQSGNGEGAFLYRDVLDAEIAWLEKEMAER
ncbi:MULTISPECIES: hypothetical protein [Gordonibacter]|uniref:NACHT domain-containing protein n=1 Tax=Gordonibacter faecis TaxID=3047475 RepID=A0ABT7DL37_9ACTN|nr:hypothetical protein [Gordonibacter sp. KGMB12511]MDJ1650247.1 hypothetical protein [Gordonibacter sp. KGMB12511]